tara:strand:+ start:328 stop:603 length:276 start_codon:yes stop_codon:yes gene_type:complete
MKINEFKIFLNNSFLDIIEYTDRLNLTFFGQIPIDNMQLGDIIFLFIVGLFILSLFLSKLSIRSGHKKVGLESYYLDQIRRHKKVQKINKE